MKLIRYGLKWTSQTEFVCHPMLDGYWTPWHEAEAEIKRLQQIIADMAGTSKQADDDGHVHEVGGCRDCPYDK